MNRGGLNFAAPEPQGREPPRLGLLKLLLLCAVVMEGLAILHAAGRL